MQALRWLRPWLGVQKDAQIKDEGFERRQPKQKDPAGLGALLVEPKTA